MNHSEEPRKLPVKSEWSMLEIFILLKRKGGLRWIITKRNVSLMFVVTLEVSYFRVGWVAIAFHCHNT